MPGIIAPGESHLFNADVEVDPVEFKKKLPGFLWLIERITSTKHSLLCLAYRDLAGNRFYSIINGSGCTNYEEVFEHGQIPEDNLSVNWTAYKRACRRKESPDRRRAESSVRGP